MTVSAEGRVGEVMLFTYHQFRFVETRPVTRPGVVRLISLRLSRFMDDTIQGSSRFWLDIPV